MITKQQIKHFIKTYGIPIVSLATLTGVSRGHIYNILQGRKTVSVMLGRALMYAELRTQQLQRRQIPLIFVDEPEPVIPIHYTIRQAANNIRVSTTTIYGWINAAKLTIGVIGNGRRVIMHDAKYEHQREAYVSRIANAAMAPAATPIPEAYKPVQI